MEVYADKKEPRGKPGLEKLGFRDDRSRRRVRKKMIKALVTKDLSGLPEELQNMNMISDIAVLYTNEPLTPSVEPGYRARRRQEAWG
jgi:hypothetical protein